MAGTESSRQGEAVVVSCGFHRTHVTIAAHEAAARGLLTRAITGAYPTRRVRRILNTLRLNAAGRLARLIEREESIPPAKLRALFLPELVEEVGRLMERVPALRRGGPKLKALAMQLYGWLAGRELGRVSSEARIYHFRAGFGHSSLEAARRRGLIVLGDHAAAHPGIAERLVERPGAIGEITPASNTPPIRPVWRAIREDIDGADFVVVNSRFVADQFVAVGWPSDRVHVVYLGVDDAFLRHVGTPVREPQEGPLRLMYAGRLEAGKGANVLLDGLGTMTVIDWRLTIAGPVAADIRRRHGRLLGDPRVTLLGTINRRELANHMLDSEIFLFPSFAEGSARVVFEAMASGCFVITTRESGTVVKDGVHGSLVPAGDTEELRSALAAAAVDRRRLAQIGNSNARVISERYRQSDYGDALAAVYEKLAG